MTDNAYNTNLVQTASADQIGPCEASDNLNGAEAQPAKADVLRAAFRDGDIALVEWLNPRTLVQAPWDMWYSKVDMPPAIGGMSVGFVFDLPDDKAIWIRSHMPDGVFFDAIEEDVEEGDVVIPYSSVTFFGRLLATSNVFNRHADLKANEEPAEQR